MTLSLPLTKTLIESLLPDPPEFYVGYSIKYESHMWWSVWLLHPDYSYKEGVKTIYCWIKKNGGVYRPGINRKPSSDKVCEVLQLYKQNPHTLVYTKPSPLLRFL